MRKKIIAVLCVLLLMLTACQEKAVKNGIYELSIDEVSSRMHDENKDTFFLYLSNDDCYSCDEFKSMIKKLQKEKPFVMYYVNVDLTKSRQDLQKELDEMEIAAGEFEMLPTSYYIVNGVIQQENIKQGYIEPDDFSTWLRTLNIW